MRKVFEKIIEKLEERTSFFSDCTKYGNKDAEQQNKSYSTMMMYEVADLVDDLIEIVKQEAEKYNNKKTNADRIRSISDEELAEFLEQIVSGNRNVIGINCGNSKCESWKCTECISMWLQSEAE